MPQSLGDIFSVRYLNVPMLYVPLVCNAETKLKLHVIAVYKQN